MTQNFQDRAELTAEPSAFAARRFDGEPGVAHHLFGAAMVIVLWFTLNMIMGMILATVGLSDSIFLLTEGSNWIDLKPEQDGAALVACAIALLSPALFLPAVWVVTRFVVRRPFASVLSSASRFRWAEALTSMVTFFIAAALVSVLMDSFFKTDNQFIYDPARYWRFVPLVLILVPFQALGEEVFVRGFLYQTVSSFTARLVFRLALPSVIFAMLHLTNPDFIAGGFWALASYFGFGVYFAWITIKSDGVEHATAVHTINNLSAFLITTTAGAGLPFATLYFDPTPDYRVGFFGIAIIAVLHYVLTFWLAPRFRR